MRDFKRAAAGGPLGYSFTIFLYLGLNSSLNMMNKYVLGIRGFHFPVFLTVCHMGFSFVMLLPVMLLAPYRVTHHAVLSKQWKGLCAIGAFMAANIALNNLSLVHITLSLNQIIRSSIPVVTALMAVPIEGKVPGRFEFTSLVVLTSGVMLCVWEGTVAGSITGVMYCITATVSNAAMMTFSGRILSERLDVIRLTFYTAPVSCICLLPIFFLTERHQLSSYLQMHSSDATWIVLVTSANALAYNAVHYLTIQITSAVTTTVLGMVKIIGLLVLSSLLLGEGRLFTPKLALGCTLAVAGFAMYSYTKLNAAGRASAAAQQQQQQQPMVININASGSSSAAAGGGGKLMCVEKGTERAGLLHRSSSESERVLLQASGQKMPASWR